MLRHTGCKQSPSHLLLVGKLLQDVLWQNKDHRQKRRKARTRRFHREQRGQGSRVWTLKGHCNVVAVYLEQRIRQTECEQIGRPCKITYEKPNGNDISRRDFYNIKELKDRPLKSLYKTSPKLIN